MSSSRWAVTIVAIVGAFLRCDPAHAKFGEQGFVSFEAQSGAALIVESHTAATIWLDEGDYSGVV